MKKVIKFIWYRYFGKPIYSILRHTKNFYTPSERMILLLRFIGRVHIKTGDNKSFYLYNNGFYLETAFFWLGPEKFSWEYMSRRIWTNLCRSSDTIFDIGANSGIYAVLARAYQPRASVYAFEPQPNIFKVLLKNNSINGFDIHTENQALADKEGELPFYNYGKDTFTTGNSTAGSLNKTWRPEEQDSIQVSVTTLKNFVKKHDISQIDLMKIDVETFEYEVLSGYGDFLKMHQPVILLEIQDRSIGEKIKSLLDPLRYEYYSVDEKRGLKPVEVLGTDSENHNYLVGPPARLKKTREFIVKDE